MPYTLDFELKYSYASREPGNLALLLEVPLTAGLKKIFDTSAGLVETYGQEVALRSFTFEHNTCVYFAATPGHRRNLLGLQGWIRHF